MADEKPEEAFTLADGVRHYHSQLDAIHKMWNHLALFGGAAVAVA